MRPVILATVLATACGGGAEGRAGDRNSPATGSTGQEAEEAQSLPDSLALTAPGGVEVWYTLARPNTAADGSRCVDRALEIRRGETRVPVPLLYTGTSPELVNDSTIRARLSDRCAPGDVYLVDLKSGRPVREK